MEYIIKEDTIIFSNKYNNALDIYLISKYKKLIFSDYELNDNLFERYEDSKLKDLSSLKSKFNQSVSNLPLNLTHLTFGVNFNQDVSNLPPNLTHLTFGDCFNKEVNNLPINLTHLIFGYYFNQVVNNLPLNLSHLTFGCDFNQDISNLPPNINYLTFGYCFNQEVNCLPPNLTHLTFSWHFNKKVDNLPGNLTHLTFGTCFNQELNNLPPTITHLTLGVRFQKFFEIPYRIKYLKLGCNNKYIIDNIPNNVEELDYGFNLELNNLPTSIIKLTFQKYCKYNKELNCLPNFIEQIQLNEEYDKQIKNIQKSLKKIICSSNYKYISSGIYKA